MGNGFSDLFQDRTHCALYEKGNVDHIIEITDYYRAHPAERKAIARQGYETVMATHTSLHRAQALLDTVARQPLHEFVAKRQMRQAPIRWSLASVYESAARTYGQAVARAEEDIRRRHFLKLSEQYNNLAQTIRGQLNPLVAA